MTDPSTMTGTEIKADWDSKKKGLETTLDDLEDLIDNFDSLVDTFYLEGDLDPVDAHWKNCTTRYLQMRNVEKGIFKKCIHNISEGHYIPHFGAPQPRSTTTPLRMVISCATGHPSINECLLPGGNLLNDLPSLIRMIRTYPIAFTGDISQAYNSVALNEDDLIWTLFMDENSDQHRNLKFLRVLSYCILKSVHIFRLEISSCFLEQIAKLERKFTSKHATLKH